jgi:hypothetical protein
VKAFFCFETSLRQPLYVADVIVVDHAYDHLEQIETVEYNTVLSDSVFSLCPEGTGPNTIRLWESMAIGSIPVLFENDWIRPNIEGYNWDDFSVTISTNDLNNIFEILKSIPVGKIEEMRQNCINAYNIIRLRTCF